jgi:hypothetical protein
MVEFNLEDTIEKLVFVKGEIATLTKILNNLSVTVDVLYSSLVDLNPVVDTSYLDIVDAMLLIADKCYYVDIPNRGSKFDRFKNLLFAWDKFEFFSFDGVNIVFRNFKSDPVQRHIFKSIANVGSLKDIHDICISCGIKSMYKNIRFRGRPTLCTIVPVKDFLPVVLLP